MIETLDDFKKEFKKIRDKGWILTHRSGTTGVGKTLEDLLGIPENNDQAPDFGEYELKATRTNSNSMLTLITKAPLPAKSNTDLRLKYGYSSSAYNNDEKVLHATLSATNFTRIADTGNLLKIGFDTENFYIESQNGRENIYWSFKSLKRAFEKKIHNRQIVYVNADSQGRGNNEKFNYTEAYLLYGINSDNFIDLIKKGIIYVDLRIGQYPDGRTHDHGTGFRIRECDHYLLFSRNRLI